MRQVPLAENGPGRLHKIRKGKNGAGEAENAAGKAYLLDGWGDLVDNKRDGWKTGHKFSQEEGGCLGIPLFWSMDTQKMEEFERAGMLLGEEGLRRLGQSTVAVFGVGGVGSHCIEALARCGVGRLVLVDSDVVSRSNINRQSVAFQSTVGQFKTRVMKDIIGEISPETEVITMEAFILEDNLDSLMEGTGGRIDYIVDAIDTVTAKLELARYAAERKIPLIASMGTGNKLHPELFRIADISETSVCPLCRVMRRELKKRGIGKLKVLYSTEQPLKPEGSAASRPLEETFKNRRETGRTEEEAAGAGRPEGEAAGTGRTEGEAAGKEPSEMRAAGPVSPGKRAVPGSVSFVPPIAGLLIAGQVIRELAGAE